MKKWLILGGLLCLFGGLASASIIPTFTNETGGGSLFTYNYDVTLDSLQNLVTGNQLCFSDVSVSDRDSNSTLGLDCGKQHELRLSD